MQRKYLRERKRTRGDTTLINAEGRSTATQDLTENPKKGKKTQINPERGLGKGKGKKDEDRDLVSEPSGLSDKQGDRMCFMGREHKDQIGRKTLQPGKTSQPGRSNGLANERSARQWGNVDTGVQFPSREWRCHGDEGEPQFRRCGIGLKYCHARMEKAGRTILVRRERVRWGGGGGRFV